MIRASLSRISIGALITHDSLQNIYDDAVFPAVAGP